MTLTLKASNGLKTTTSIKENRHERQSN